MWVRATRQMSAEWTGSPGLFPSCLPPSVGEEVASCGCQALPFSHGGGWSPTCLHLLFLDQGECMLTCSDLSPPCISRLDLWSGMFSSHFSPSSGKLYVHPTMGWCPSFYGARPQAGSRGPVLSLASPQHLVSTEGDC